MKITTSKPTLNELDKSFDDSISGADTQRAAHLGEFQRVRSVRTNCINANFLGWNQVWRKSPACGGFYVIANP
ncbi:MAG: hypothetical protein IPP22_08080 [Nitrosomonas sp.]|nr:hypothetical protein [Nitrosomonas sp.]